MGADAQGWGAFLRHFELEPHELDRLALFLLAHAFLDRWLIHAIALKEFKDRVEGGVRIRDSDEEIDRLISENAKGEFGKHMGQAKGAGVLPAPDRVICEEVNRARNRFLHWEPGRFKVPTYQGQAVTTEAGLLQCLSDIDKVIVTLQGRIDAA